MGLEDSERIHRIILHPDDPNTLWVGVLGPAWSDGSERGVYRTRDGGETWDRVLFVNESTGTADLVQDPNNPDHLIAAMWQFRRWPWFFESGGEGSGIHVTWDGGDSWTRLDAASGLPAGEIGRTGLAFAPGNPEVVYALVESENTALFRSDDGGESWRSVNSGPGVSPRPFYFSDLRVDPANENRVYRLSSPLDVSEDGGRSFTTVGGWDEVHPDHHDLWISPDGHTLINGNDGGIFISLDRGDTWRFVQNIPVAQFYHISVDMAKPFNVLGGLQDNGSWMGPSELWESPAFIQAGIMNHHWKSIGFGDGFAAMLDTGDPTVGYSSSQGGNIVRFDLQTNEWKSVGPGQPDDDTTLRFNWNAGMAVDPHSPGTLYYGSQFVHRSRDQGHSWEIISPDLTTDDPEKQRQEESGGLTIDVTAAENHTSILTIAPSPVEQGVIWVGTDDGNVQLTRDGGATWTNLVERIRGVPGATWVPHVEASKHDAATAYVVFDNHRRGDWTTYVYRTRDFGQTWESLASPDIDGFVHVIEEDPVRPELLFVGTEFGLFVSLDAGRSWQRHRGGLPTVPVRALVVHPRDPSLVIGTHGRGAYVIDDISPLRDLAGGGSAIQDAAVHLFSPEPATAHMRGVVGPMYFPGNDNFIGENRPYGALITYHVGQSAGAPASGEGSDGDGPGATVRILDGSGALIRELEGPAAADRLHRVTWNLRRSGFKTFGGEDIPEMFRPQGPEVLPGTYTVEVSVGGQAVTTPLTVVGDPRREVSMADRQAKHDALMAVGGKTDAVVTAWEHLDGTREQLEFVQGRLEEETAMAGAPDPEDSEAVASAEARSALSGDVAAALEEAKGLMARIRQQNDGQWVPDHTASADLGQVYGALDSSRDRPTVAQMEAWERARAKADAVLADVEVFYRDRVPALDQAVRALGLAVIRGGEH
jgi:photosystem II stability/assembly factor-like uncharacterized protein